MGLLVFLSISDHVVGHSVYFETLAAASLEVTCAGEDSSVTEVHQPRQVPDVESGDKFPAFQGEQGAASNSLAAQFNPKPFET